MYARRLAVALVLVASVAVACSGEESSSLPRPSKPFCEAAHRYDVRVERQAPIGEQIQIVQEMVDHAPRDIARDAATFLDALQRRRDGDKSVIDNPKIEQAVNHVNVRAAQGCDFYQSDSGGM
ncbi:MAG TPA: hypothetical protein VEP49_16305 [Acidimicrobiia bacterium]|nr:hypothetical protein [Acidimicrobiia bacterium]